MAAVTQRISGFRAWLAALLCPNWRWMSLLGASFFLFLMARINAPAQGGLQSYQGIESVSSGALAFFFLWVASRPEQPAWYAAFWQRLPRPLHWPGWRGLLTMIMIINTFYTITWHVGDLVTGHYHTDAMAYIHMDADLVLHGKNPYADSNAFWTAVVRWPDATATQLLGSHTYGNNPSDYPAYKKMRSTQIAQAQNPALRGNDYDPGIVANYPAGIIWLALPFVWAGLPSILWLNLILFALMASLIIFRAPKEERWPLGLALVAAPVLMDYGLFVNFDVACLLFVLAAWNWLDKRVTSALLFGFACAVKQLAWFIAPFYLLAVGFRYGWREALKRSGIAAVAFVIPNLPFIINAPQAWVHSMLIPMTDPNFPLGYGPITFAMSGNIPYGSSHLWLGAVLLALVSFLVMQIRSADRNYDALLLSLVPLWFSWRSPMNYFNLIPVFAAWIAVTHILAQRAKAVEPPQHAAEEEPSDENALPPLVIAEPDYEPERELAGVR